MEHAVLKTLAAFMNSKGGTLFVGVNDDGVVVGLDDDNFPNEDKMALHLDNLIKSRLGGGVFACLKPEFGEIGGKRFLAVECEASSKPVFLKNGDAEEFYIRAGASSPALPASHAHEYIQERFK
jgi:predicted HTH transcriptional regulator